MNIKNSTKNKASHKPSIIQKKQFAGILSEKLKALRKRNNVTQEQLAEFLGISKYEVAFWENGKRLPGIEYTMQIAKFFNITTDSLFEYDIAENHHKADEYCEQYDYDIFSYTVEWRIEMLRRTLKEYPGEEKLLFRLAKALYDGWYEQDHSFTWDHGCRIPEYEKIRAFDYWEEAADIMERILITSADNSIRSECCRLLADIYGKTGDMEKLYEVAGKCVDVSLCKEVILAQSTYGKEEHIYQQKSMLSMLGAFKINFLASAKNTKNAELYIKACNIIIGLYKFIFSDGNYGLYETVFSDLYQEYASALMLQGRIGEAVEAFETAYKHTKSYDDQISRYCDIRYTAPFVNRLEEKNSIYYSIRRLPELLNFIKIRVLNSDEIQSDPRYLELIEKIESDIDN